MSENGHRRRALMVRQKDVRVGDILSPDFDYQGDDETVGAVCESVSPDRGTNIKVTWRILATGGTYTSISHKDDRVYLMRRAPGASARDNLWDKLGMDAGRGLVSRAEFEEYMDAYDRAMSAGPVRPDEEST